MKALTYHAASDDFVLADLPMPEPGPGDVLVKVAACGLNPVDSKIYRWNAAAPGMNDNWVPGLDVSGEIVALGEGVTSWQIGDKVLYHGDMFRPHGGFAEYAIHAAATLTAHPDVDPVTAASTPCAGWTAWRALVDKLRLQSADPLLIIGGSGGVGSFAVQIARIVGCDNIFATSSGKNADYVRDLGATTVIDYCSEDVVTRVQELTSGAGVRCALDTVGGDNDILAANSLGYEGEMVELVQATRPEAYADAFMLGKSFHQLSLGSGHRNGERGVRELVAAGEAFNRHLSAGEIRAPKVETISLEQVGESLKAIREQRTVGKIVLKF